MLKLAKKIGIDLGTPELATWILADCLFSRIQNQVAVRGESIVVVIRE